MNRSVLGERLGLGFPRHSLRASLDPSEVKTRHSAGSGMARGCLEPVRKPQKWFYT